MRLTADQKRILDGKEGCVLQQAMEGLVKYGTAMGAEELIPVSSAHTFLASPRAAAEYFQPRRVQLPEEQVAALCQKLTRVQFRAKTTIDPAQADLRKWQQMGATEETYAATRQITDICREMGVMANWTCIPYLEANTPVFGEHCSWSESSAVIYCNSMLGARTNRDGGEASFFSGLLGLTPNCGMHLEQNRKGTHLIDVRCDIGDASEWGTLGYFAGEMAGDGIPVFVNLRRPELEQAKQLGAAINVPGGAPMFHIVGATPEAPTLEAAFGGKAPKETYIYDASARKKAYESINFQPEGKVSMVSFGCPHLTLYEIKEISRLLKGKHVARDTRLCVMTTESVRAAAEQIGFAQTIEASGGEVFAGGCLSGYYIDTDSKQPNLERVATDSVKQALIMRRSFGSKVFFGSTERCVQAAIEGGV